MKRWTGFVKFCNGKWWSTAFEVEVVAGSLAVAMHRSVSQATGKLRDFQIKSGPEHRRGAGRMTRIRAASITIACSGTVKRQAESTDVVGS
jgi:hypothetical protein